MTFDVAVVGAPFLDLTFEGLERIPQPGEEIIGTALHVAPGGTGMQAIAAARLGLRTALVAPIGRHGMAALLRGSLDREGVHVISRDDASAKVPVTALLSTGHGVAMATALTTLEPAREDVEECGAAAVVLSAGRLPLAPPGATTYVVTGGLELEHIDASALKRMSGARALILNAAEAIAITKRDDSEDAAQALGAYVESAVVTMGADGAVAADQGGRIIHADSPQVEVLDATGAGDLFAAAYVWADLRGAPLDERLAWACLYAGLSVRAPTAFDGALALPELLSEGSSRGLTPPGHGAA
jgi:sugar/nucleoside kinase (ribokinase family)